MIEKQKSKKYLTLFKYLIAAAFFTSCQKDVSVENFPLGPDSTITTVGSRVKSYTEEVTSAGTNTMVTFNLEYDNAGKVVSLISTTNPGDKFLYNFPSGNKFTMDLYNSNILSIHEDLFVNSNLLVDSTYQYNDTQDTSSEKYFYNASNQLIKINEYEINDGKSTLWNTTTNTYNNDGDLITSSGDGNKEVINYTYFTDLSYAIPVAIGFPNILTASKAHLKKTITVTSNGFPAGSGTFTYTFDSLNRLSTETATSSDGGIVKKTYNYQ